ncbi:hypothetical protein AAFF_G00417560 [Aldrovandia affinis]|uniref:Uncharacterized protein n=1 Tax=Aldrovandia affinis TaxID=143900 RepID=A0AAD7WJ92_9TELE|nr:hypothetical protein AAFF_G00417560 [Aldrovandia affinis]
MLRVSSGGKPRRSEGRPLIRSRAQPTSRAGEGAERNTWQIERLTPQAFGLQSSAPLKLGRAPLSTSPTLLTPKRGPQGGYIITLAVSFSVPRHCDICQVSAA